MNSLPIDIILPELRAALSTQKNVVLSAEPGAGKTTRVPISLLNEKWLNGKKVLMLEPRRLAAIRSSTYMSEQLGEKVGETIGYRIRGENRVGKNTRIEVVTEGILTRMIQDDASLPDVGIIIFDEFHERSIHADLGLALSLNVQEHLRNDLKILVMSATLDGIAISSLLDNAPIIKSEGRSFPVETKYLPQHHDGFIEPLVANTIVKALREREGDILVFLPGQREIRRVESLLQEKELSGNIVVHSLYGEASPEKQKSALAVAQTGKRKIILSTNIAETSLTIEGVRVVIDSGFVRSAKFDPRRGMSGLVTIPISQASADQRKGRAGRESSGVCYRLWTEAQHSQRSRYSQPEILTADLAPLAIELALWGDGEGTNLKFLDPPSKTNLLQARNLLQYLGALDAHGNLTEHGKQIAKIPTHPRYAHMLLKGKELNIGELACDVVALLDERDIFKKNNDTEIDLFSRFIAFKEGKTSDTFLLQRIREQSLRLKRMLGLSNDDSTSKHKTMFTINPEETLGLLLALAYPERVAKRKSGDTYQLSGNSVASLPKNSRLSKEEYLAVGDVDGAGNDVKIFLAEPISESDILKLFSEQITHQQKIEWNEKEESIIARRVTSFGAIEISEKKFVPTAEQSQKIMIQVIRNLGISILPWTKESEELRRRSEWLRKQNLVSEWIDLSDEYLLSTLEVWLSPFLDGITRKVHLTKLNMQELLRSLFSYEQIKLLDKLVPTHLSVPTGSKIPIDYSTDQPILAVRLQEMFGETETPTVGGGKMKVLLHLLSPARRPIAVTQDLPSFWKNAYNDVRKDMRGQYPKHYWPENPLEAEPTRRTKKYM